ncbi:MAG TPA: undecaprenyl-diphosphatase UppP [Methanobacterium sp.]|nr:undecaprenyl-diphosphatase UppP [Methanobacterium sp.]
MDILQAIIIGIAQGLTEFLPVSSSAHLVFVPQLLGTQSSLAYDTILHIATLVAVVVYFWKDVVQMLWAFFSSISDILHGEFKNGLKQDNYKKLAWMVIIGTIPAGLAGILFKDFFEGLFSNIPIVGFFLLITGVLLYTSEMVSRKAIHKNNIKEMTLKNSLIIGVAQAFSIAPGISRSGATISTGLYLGLERELAARFSFLLSIPAILGAALVQTKDISSIVDVNTMAVVAGFIAAVVTGYLAIKIVIKLISERDLLIFAYYCWIVGALTLILSFYYGII